MYNIRKTAEYLIRKKPFINNLFWRGVQIAIKQITNFLIFFLSAKLLTPNELGIFTYAFRIITMLSLLSDFGFSTATSNFVAELHVRSPTLVNKLKFNVILLVLLFSLFLSAVFLLLAPSLLPDTYEYSRKLLPLLAIVPLISLFDGIYRGQKQFKKLSVLYIITNLISIIPVYLLISKTRLNGTIWAQILYYAVQLIILWIGNANIVFRFDKSMIFKIAKYSGIIGIGNIGAFLLTNFNSLILGIFKYLEEVAYYEFANKLFTLIMLASLIYSQVLAPEISCTFIGKEKISIIHKLKSHSGIIVVIFTIISILVGFATPIILQTYFPQYNNKFTITYIYSFLAIIPLRAIGDILFTAFIIPTGQARLSTIINISSGLINVPLSIILIILLGPIGVCVSMVLISLVSIIVAYILYYKTISKLFLYELEK